MATSLYRQCARMFMIGFPRTEPSPDFLNLVRGGVFGAILFKRNLGTAADIAGLCRRIKEEAGRPLALAIDQEGGRVARLRGPPFTALPPMREIGLRGDEGLAERVGRVLAFELRALGLDWDFAPVLDVDSNPLNPVIGDRAFHRDPQVVARLGVALARGLEASGVSSCGKHFPGHGDTIEDSHLTLPRLPHPIERLRRTELVPFAAYARVQLAAVMTAHVIFDAVDPAVPATMSAAVVDGILRKELGFEGVVVSDDLEMKAIVDHFPLEEVVESAARAGVDLFLACHRADVQERAIELLIKAVETGEVPKGRIEESNRRLDALASRFVHPPEDRLHTLGSAEHRSLTKSLSPLPLGEG